MAAGETWVTKTPESVGPISFCTMVNYTLACDSDLPDTSCNDTYAAGIFTNFGNALSVYSCEEYSRLYTCANCTESYKRWLCAVVFRRANPDVACSGDSAVRGDGEAQPACVLRTCQDVCYDVVRKCPIHLGFKCPPVSDVREYAAPGDTCNNLDRAIPSSASRAAASAAVTALAAVLLLVL